MNKLVTCTTEEEVNKVLKAGDIPAISYKTFTDEESEEGKADPAFITFRCACTESSVIYILSGDPVLRIEEGSCTIRVLGSSRPMIEGETSGTIVVEGFDSSKPDFGSATGEISFIGHDKSQPTNWGSVSKTLKEGLSEDVSCF